MAQRYLPLYCDHSSCSDMGKLSLFVCMILCIWCCTTIADPDAMIYKDPKQPLNRRIKDLIDRMTLQEKIGQMTQIDRSVATPDVMRNYFIGEYKFIFIYRILLKFVQLL